MRKIPLGQLWSMLVTLGTLPAEQRNERIELLLSPKRARQRIIERCITTAKVIPFPGLRT